MNGNCRRVFEIHRSTVLLFSSTVRCIVSHGHAPHTYKVVTADRPYVLAGMGDLSNSGVRNIRAMFEAKSESTPPPSRGRSPAGSEDARSSSSRPVSKIRTSFVAVERSGQMGPQLGVRKLSDVMGDQNMHTDGSNESDMTTSGTNQQPQGSFKPSGSIGSTSTPGNMPLEELKEEAIGLGPESTSLDAGANINTKSQNGMVDQAVNSKPAADDTLDVDPKPNIVDGIPENNGSAPPKDTTADLGSVLKGSPFEPEPIKDANESTVKDANDSTVHEPTKSQKTITASNTPNTKVPRSGKSQPNGYAKGGPKPVKVSSGGSRPLPSAAKDNSLITLKNGIEKLTIDPTKSPKVSQSPKTPTTSAQKPQPKNASPRQTPSKTSSPRQHLPVKEPSQRATKESTKTAPAKPIPTSQASQTTKSSDSKAQRTIHQSNSVHKSSTLPKTNSLSVPHSAKAQPSRSTNSPPAPTNKRQASNLPSVSVKLRPKSPTRPVRLPAAATAATESFAAKVGDGVLTSQTGAAGDRPVRRVSVLNKDRQTGSSRVPPSTASSDNRKKSSRPSLPAVHRGFERPSSRASAAGPKIPEEGFLARMMRPTASSASKTHEKNEPKSPPRKVAPVKPKRKSEGGEDGKASQAEVKTDLVESKLDLLGSKLESTDGNHSASNAPTSKPDTDHTTAQERPVMVSETGDGEGGTAEPIAAQ